MVQVEVTLINDENPAYSDGTPVSNLRDDFICVAGSFDKHGAIAECPLVEICAIGSESFDRQPGLPEARGADKTDHLPWIA